MADKYAELRKQVSPRVADLLTLMWAYWKFWRPMTGYPSVSAGFQCGGAYSEYSYEDFESSTNRDALKATELAWSELNAGQRLAVELAYGMTPRVFDTPRHGGIEAVFASAIAVLERVLRKEGMI